MCVSGHHTEGSDIRDQSETEGNHMLGRKKCTRVKSKKSKTKISVPSLLVLVYVLWGSFLADFLVVIASLSSKQTKSIPNDLFMIVEHMT